MRRSEFSWLTALESLHKKIRINRRDGGKLPGTIDERNLVKSGTRDIPASG